MENHSDRYEAKPGGDNGDEAATNAFRAEAQNLQKTQHNSSKSHWGPDESGWCTRINDTDNSRYTAVLKYRTKNGTCP